MAPTRRAMAWLAGAALALPSVAVAGETALRGSEPQLLVADLANASHRMLAEMPGEPPYGWGDHGYCGQQFDPGSVYHTMHDDPVKWVEVHNHYRRCHGSPDVIWDDALVPFAKSWTLELLTRCNGVVEMNSFRQVSPPNIHRPHDPHSYYEDPPNAENLAGFDSPLPFSPVTQAQVMTAESSSVEGWYREVETQCPNQGLTYGCGGMINHYTAMMWKTVTRIGCYSAARGNFKVVSCRYAVGPVGSGTPSGCGTPNTVGCDQEEVPPRVDAARCPAWGGQMAMQIPLNGFIGNIVKPVLNPEGGKPPPLELSGSWNSQGGKVHGVTTIWQNGDDVVMTNDASPWSPAKGHIKDRVVYFDEPAQVAGVTGTPSADGRQFLMSTGVNFLRIGDPPVHAPEPEPVIVVGLPSVDVMPYPVQRGIGAVSSGVSQVWGMPAVQRGASTVTGYATSAKDWMGSWWNQWNQPPAQEPQPQQPLPGAALSPSRLFAANLPSLAARGAPIGVWVGLVLVGVTLALVLTLAVAGWRHFNTGPREGARSLLSLRSSYSPATTTADVLGE